ncbi:MAG: hypothetical protein HPY90_13575 [Syntrophothermus sp.]|uniref:hypothetical protein n=1 Tax=Syntrophothermus sp. TaxID=2736299 RepID=UPI00257EA908|nr:hypothetical protein [Syntrophothermus sp.]NSW84275.1 hypothetical protein [Syntrophothermus sp.]
MALIRVRLNKATLYFTPQELTGLLAKDPALWTKAIKRGKAVLRQRQAEQRAPKHIGEILPDVLEEIKRRAERAGKCCYERGGGHQSAFSRGCPGEEEGPGRPGGGKG